MANRTPQTEARRIKNAMDKTVDPCDDFYKYSCGNWTSAHSKTLFEELKERNFQRIKTFLETRVDYITILFSNSKHAKLKFLQTKFRNLAEFTNEDSHAATKNRQIVVAKVTGKENFLPNKVRYQLEETLEKRKRENRKDEYVDGIPPTVLKVYESSVLSKTRYFYQNCTETMNNHNEHNSEENIRLLNHILKTQIEWKISKKRSGKQTHHDRKSFSRHLGLIHKHKGVLFAPRARKEVRHELNDREYMLTFYQQNFPLFAINKRHAVDCSLPKSRHHRYPVDHGFPHRYVSHYESLVAEIYSSFDEDVEKKVVRKIVDLDLKLARFAMTKEQMEHHNFEHKQSRIYSLEHLQTNFHSINQLSYFKNLLTFDIKSLKMDFEKDVLHGDKNNHPFVIRVICPRYFSALDHYIAHTEQEDFMHYIRFKRMASYIKGTVFSDLFHFESKFKIQRLAKFNFKNKQTFFTYNQKDKSFGQDDVKHIEAQDLHLRKEFRNFMFEEDDEDEGNGDIKKKNLPVSDSCVSSTSAIQGFAILQEMTLERYTDEERTLISNMTNGIRNSFSDIIQRAAQLDRQTKAAALRKMKHLRNDLFAPNFVQNSTKIREFYISLKPRNGFLRTYLEYKHFIILRNFISLKNTPNDTSQSLDFHPAAVNAFYNPDTNLFSLPAGIIGLINMKFRCWGAMYGTIGIVIGHEFTHGFDTKGARINEDGIQKTQMTNRSLEHFKIRAERVSKAIEMCPVDVQYKNGTVDRMYPSGHKLLAETIADMGGALASQETYFREILSKQKGREVCPGLENTTLYGDKLFFISMSQMLCNEMKRKVSAEVFKHDVHATSYCRVQNIVRNSKQFSDAFGCEAGTAMNPRKKVGVQTD